MAEWPDCKFENLFHKAMIKLKSTYRQNNDNLISFNSIQPRTNGSEAEADKSKEEELHLDPSRYSKLNLKES